jgi:hypothetical protein
MGRTLQMSDAARPRGGLPKDPGTQGRSSGRVVRYSKNRPHQIRVSPSPRSIFCFTNCPSSEAPPRTIPLFIHLEHPNHWFLCRFVYSAGLSIILSWLYMFEHQYSFIFCLLRYQKGLCSLPDSLTLGTWNGSRWCSCVAKSEEVQWKAVFLNTVR